MHVCRTMTCICFGCSALPPQFSEYIYRCIATSKIILTTCFSCNRIEINNLLEVFVQISKTSFGFCNNLGLRPRLLPNPTSSSISAQTPQLVIYFYDNRFKKISKYVHFIEVLIFTPDEIEVTPHFKRGCDLSPGVKINTSIFIFTLLSGLHKGGSLSLG